MRSRSVEITLSALVSAFGQVGLVGSHPMFAAGTRHAPESLAGELEDAAHGELSRLGLLDRGRVSDQFEDAVYALAQPEAEYVACVDNRGEHYTVLVGVRGRVVVTAVRSGDRVRVQAEDGRQAPAAVLVANLPACPPAQLPRISLPQEEFRGDDSDFPADRSRLARSVDLLLGQPAFGRGEINVSVRGPGGGRRVADGVLTYRDLMAGRVAFEVTGPEQNRYVTATSGEDQALARKVAALRAALDG